MSASAPVFSRRRALTLGLQAGLVLGCTCFFPAGLLASSAGGLGRGKHGGRPPADVGGAQAARMRADFDAVSQGVAAMLTPRLGQAGAQNVARGARERFSALLPDIPDIGPGNRNAESLLEAVWLTAITQAMLASPSGGLTHRDAGRLFYDMCAAEMARAPEAEMRAKGKAMFNVVSRAGLAAWARRTQARKYPGDWVATAVAGDGATFDIGYDYSQCGAVLFFRAHGVEKVAPYFCLNDFTMSRAQGTGLTRRHTIGQGDALCDFRYKLDGPVTQSWETEEPRFRKS